MSNQHRAVDVKRIHHRKYVIPEVVRRIIAVGWCGLARCARPSPRNAVEVMSLGELWGEAIETMRGIPSPRQEDERPAGSAPIHNFKLNTLLDGDQLNFMWRRVRLSHRMCRKPE